MNKELIASKSDKTKQRITQITESIKAHRKNIKLLKSKSEYHLPIKEGETFAPRVIKFTCIPRCDKRYRYTLRNLSDQINSLKQELTLLIEYGA